MKTAFRRLIVLLLALLTLASLPVTALAQSNYRYPSDQYFVMDESQTKGFTVQVSSSANYSGSCKNRDKMLAQGYDSFVYEANGQYRVMCGKFRTQDEAIHYKESICSNTDRKKAYVTNLYVPDWAYTEFAEIYSTDPLNNQGEGYTAWEQPSGPYYDGDQAGSTRLVYTVQFSSGTSFHGSEQHRDDMIAQGFDAFVYKKNGKYRTLSGQFETKQEAENRCSAIKKYTDQSDAYVTTVELPTSYVSYQAAQAQDSYYAIYQNLLLDFNWAWNYLPRDDAEVLAGSGSSALDYRYYVSDVDANGVDDLIIVDVVAIYEGVWAVFSCNKGGAYLMGWGAAFSTPLVSVCQEKGALAMQSYYKGVGSCSLFYFRNGQMTDEKNATIPSDDYIEVYPTDADRNAFGYYVNLTGYEVGDFSRLAGRSGQHSGNAAPASAPASTAGGYTWESIWDAADSAAANSSKYSTVSDKNVELEVPPTSQLLSNPFLMKAYAEKNGKAIYIMPKPVPGNGNLGKVSHGELVTILAENDYYYFFVTADGRAGWNGKSYFTNP